MTQLAPFAARAGAPVHSFMGALWIFGGGLAAPTDIWRSLDGRKWEKVSPSVPWSAGSLVGHSIWFDSVWVIGGHVDQGQDDDFSTQSQSSSSPKKPSGFYFEDGTLQNINVWRSTFNCE